MGRNPSPPLPSPQSLLSYPQFLSLEGTSSLEIDSRTLESYSEVGSSSGVAQISEPVTGRLKPFIRRFQQYGAAPWLLDVVQHGYSLPFVDGRLPPPYFNNRNDFEPGSEQWARDEVL